jgi:alkylation response protein AidB-like acyl-CoA dehydrogenase
VFEDYEVSGLLGEAKVLTLVEGTSEIQRLVIARDLLEF